MITPDVAATIDELLHGPVDDSYGTGTAAAIPGVDVAGKTGTTSNYVDAWFVGWTPNLTVAVWVGYPNSGKPMLTDYNGGPVEGGTYPAVIWHDFMVGAIQIMDNEAAARASKTTDTATTVFTPTVGTANTGTGSSTTRSTATTQNSATTGQQRLSDDDTLQRGYEHAREQSPTTTPNQSATVPATTTPPPPAATGTSTNGGSGL